MTKKRGHRRRTAVGEALITNRLGMHARPATLFVQTANRFKSEIFVSKDGAEVDGKSIMGILTFGAGKGTTLKIRAVGEDAEEAIEALSGIVREGFGEE